MAMNIGQNIRNRRKKLNMTLEQLALTIGLDTGNLSRIERGQQSLNFNRLSEIANALNCDSIDLIQPDHNSAPSIPDGFVRIPLLNSEQILQLNEDNNKSVNHLEINEWLMTDADISWKSFGYQISDLSMFPDFNIGDKVIISPNLEPNAGDFVLASENTQLIFRKYRSRGVTKNNTKIFELAPINEDYEAFSSEINSLKIMGVMVEHRKYRRR